MGIIRLIEDILNDLDFSSADSQKGPYNWELTQGSAIISLTYHEKTGLIIGEAALCKLPPTQLIPLYQYLLVTNDQLEGLSFSIRGTEVILSLLIQDRQFDAEKGKKLFKHLLEKADHYDNILVEKYGATWIIV